MDQMDAVDLKTFEENFIRDCSLSLEAYLLTDDDDNGGGGGGGGGD